jgi:hypothetical protein
MAAAAAELTVDGHIVFFGGDRLDVGGGGGGSSYVIGTGSIVMNLLGNTNTSGVQANAPSGSDPYYTSNIGFGGAKQADGGHGRVVITFY